MTSIAFLLALLAAPQTETSTAPPTHAEIVRKVRPSIVELTAASSYDQFIGRLTEVLDGEHVEVTAPEPSRRTQHLEVASGVVFDHEGHVVTTASFAAEGDEFRAVLSDGTETAASLVGIDLVTDLAVLRLHDVTPPPATFSTDGTDFALGGKLCIVGAPPGTSCARGEGRLKAMRLNLGIDRYHDFLLLDVPPRNGTNGAAVVNRDGTVLGIVSAKHVRGGTLAVPAPTVSKVIPALIESGTVRRAWLGLSCEERTGEPGRGARVFGLVSGGPALAAGIRPGDVITAFNDQPVPDVAGLHRLVSSSEPGSRATIRLERGDRTLNVTAELGQRKTTAGTGTLSIRIYETYLGVGTLPVHSKTTTTRGLLVRKVLDGSPAHTAGLRLGDIILTADGTSVPDTSTLTRLVRQHRAGARLLLTVLRDGEQQTLHAALAARSREIRIAAPHVSIDAEELSEPDRQPAPIGNPTDPSLRIMNSFKRRR